ncbi:hypothetical protein [Kitasatospora sp. LaBMicrA B282]|uniref:hypothetical protein n=1 Tax=Kitasatospora sp. LaBMicrA B282 TaxID=3420949 RepID=UPI003D115DAA
MRTEVQEFVAAGPLPGPDCDDEAEVDRRWQQLEAIARPVTREEAVALAGCFGPDDCYGVAWTLLHLIETSPNPVLTVRPPADEGGWQWQNRLWQRAVNAGLVCDTCGLACDNAESVCDGGGPGCDDGGPVSAT